MLPSSVTALHGSPSKSNRLEGTDSDSARNCEWNGSHSRSQFISLSLTRRESRMNIHGAREASTGATSEEGNERTMEELREGERDSLNSCTRPLAGQRRNNVDTKRPVDGGISSYGGAANLTLRGVQGRAFSPCCRQMPAQFSTLIQ